MITSQDVILYQNISCPSELLEQIKIIAAHTQNTWQQNRTLIDIIKDTTIGKIAEHTLKKHIAKYSDYIILDYDDFRTNNYKKHAPLDCIIFKKENPNLQSVINAINLDATNNPNGMMNENTKNILKDAKIYTMEIKSTRITNRHKRNGTINYQAILNDDFLAYPKFYRKVPSSIEINSWQQYLSYCINNNRIQLNTNLTTLQEIVISNMYDFYARVYVEQINSNLFDIHIVGHITKQKFIENSIIKRMPQYGKSEQALYIATQIKNGIRFKK